MAGTSERTHTPQAYPNTTGWPSVGRSAMIGREPSRVVSNGVLSWRGGGGACVYVVGG